jgi:hypothetical protein
MNIQMQKELERLEFSVAGGDLEMINQAMTDFRLAMKSEGTNVNEMLAGREARYGSFQGHAEISQVIKQVIHSAARARNKELESDQLEALDMISHKIARIINGDPNYADNWIDIAGYATLVANRLEKEDNAQ